VLIIVSEETSPTQSGGSVLDASGATVSTGFKVNLDDRTQMMIALKPGLPTGVYTVNWNTFTEDDSGMANGSFTFTIQAAAQAGASATVTTGSPVSSTIAPAATAAPAITQASTATVSAVPATSTPTASSQSAQSGSALPGWLIGLVIVAVIAVAAALILRRRSAQP
jgi:hypothetical protein